MAQPENNFVVYGFYRENWTPYYIGKGRPSRPYQKGGRPCGSPPKERILILYKNLTEEEAFKLEERLIRSYKRIDIDPENGLLYNRTYGGDGASGAIRTQKFKENLSSRMSGDGNHMFGKHHTEESKLKISRSKLGKNNGLVGEKHPNFGTKWGEERRKSMSERVKGKNNPMYGKSGELSPNWGVKFSEEHKRKISEANSGENHPNFGKPLPESTKRKLSERMRGENHPQYGKRGDLSPNFGKKHSEETKRKISESRMGNKHHGYKPRDWVHDIHGKVLNRSSSELIKLFPEQKLNKGALSKVALGKSSQHKGWKILPKNE